MKYRHLQEPFEQVNHKELEENLMPFIGASRLNKINEVIHKRLSSLHLAIEHPANINNAMAAIRTAESLGIYHIHIIAPEHEAHSVRVITQGAFFWVNIHFYHDFAEFLNTLKRDFNWPEGINLAGAALSDTACGLADVPVDKPLCILVGNEQHGLTDEAKAACQYCYMIPMAGMSQSFNLSVAAAISLYDTSQRKRSGLNGRCDLSSPEKQSLKAAYMLSSVDTRLAEQLLKDMR
jgi:tRNA (guanosine-2'-O-)-methyltransferase